MSTKTEKPATEVEARPNWKRRCCVCAQEPVVDLYEDGRLGHSTDMCGVCTFGEAECLDPEKW